MDNAPLVLDVRATDATAVKEARSSVESGAICYVADQRPFSGQREELAWPVKNGV